MGFPHFTFQKDGVKFLFVCITPCLKTMTEKTSRKEYHYDFLLGFLFVCTVIIGYSFLKTSIQIAFVTYDYMTANVKNI
ncbi:hypothetical protein A2996_01355 [Candidatus Campbellbacteria bacterium RIFCSPLOWO2_01_FULL_34_15]|uniref:Uncharacterized protein n=2 Tax=Candidatus Campbelliibacteriota TaxID=1752727 RepID=A0A1F5EPE4_9BACT|nr:MAG: hypothetical protein A2811_00535 [Candidatus Campbellbacteria bacterium RIFCSPHIGHO2_01_FULL_34_10]OGD69245.1 MAG: hypothetical protein A2996_01355 [Candidatus Campbellbacteria bacterium RIFCSPLOWO2_01_FULL_34_15]